MDFLLGVVALITLIAFSVWRHRTDIRKYGAPSAQDRKRTYLVTIAAFSILIATFFISPAIYVVVVLVLWLTSQILGGGHGKHGTWRQLRDGSFVGCVASVPICFMLWISHGQT